ncbi:MAG: FAD:protein FMN transferase [Spirochaetota bacterium]|nr:FAD:protein FMN transferase [Spirochaetota bacterium]
MNKFKLFLLLSVTLIIMISCNGNSVKPYTETSFAMGTVCSITLYEKNDDFCFDDVFSIIKEIEKKMSPVILNSEVSAINSHAAIKPVKVSKDTYYVIKEGIKYTNLPESRFDITIGPLVSLWGIGTEKQNIPEPNLIKEVLPLIGSQYIKLKDTNRSIFLENKSMAIDLGGIAKGYASDIVRDFLIEEGFTKGIINLGGNVLTFGLKAPGTLWKIGIQNPVNSRGNYIGTLEIEESAVVTSGIYERYFEVDGKRYHHILDPATGYPVNNNLLSITIVTPSGIEADAWSTLAFSAGLVKGLELLELAENIEGIFITKNKKIYVSSGLKDSFNLISTDFTLAY